jgi:hypothetical protein
VEILRSLIDRIVLHPDANEDSGYVMDIEGDLAGILSLCQTSKKAAGLSPDDLMQMKGTSKNCPDPGAAVSLRR